MDFLTGERKKRTLLAVLTAQVILCIFYGFLPPGPAAFPPFLALYSMQFLVYGVCLWMLRATPISWVWIFGAAVLARSILLFSEPVLENDFWRYLWDGRVLAHGINPYAHKPLDHALDALEVSYRHQIGWKEYGTIYPPISILVFALSHLIAADSLFALKVILTAFDIGTGLLIVAWLKALKISPVWSALYFLSPLALKETANSAHLDSIAVFFSVAAGFLLYRGNIQKSSLKISVCGWLALALAVASKLYPICFLPMFLKLDHRSRWIGFSLFLAVVALLYLPLIDAGAIGLSGTEAFARYWIFNAGLYRGIQKIAETLLHFGAHLGLLQEAWQGFLLKNDCLAKAFSGIIFAAFVGYRTLRASSITELPKELLLIAGVLLLLSPVVNAWYVLWVLPFACLTKDIPWLTFSYVVVMSYSWWYSPDLAVYLRWAEYVTFFSLLAMAWRRRALARPTGNFEMIKYGTKN